MNTASSAPSSCASCKPPSPAPSTSIRAKSSASATCHLTGTRPNTKTSRPSITGTRSAKPPNPNDPSDPHILTHQQMKSLYPHDEEKLAFAKHVMQRKARDHARTPVQWTSEAPNAGFCDASTTPWMRVNDDYETVNAAAQRAHSDKDSLSVLQFWKRGLEQRKQHKDALVYGDFELLDPEDGHDQIFAYARRGETEAFVTVLNFSDKEAEWKLPDHAGVRKWVAGNYTAGAPEKATKGKIVLKPWEGLLGKCSILSEQVMSLVTLTDGIRHRERLRDRMHGATYKQLPVLRRARASTNDDA